MHPTTPLAPDTTATATGDIPAELHRGTAEILLATELAERLARGRPLRVKAGFDPTAPDLHLGHTVLLNLLRRFQELGHKAIFLVGDFTALIGDPSGHDAIRAPMSAEEIEVNMLTYEEQVYKILDPELTEVRYNSKWTRRLGAAGLVRLASGYTVARMLEREDFHQRFRRERPIALHEFIYPLLQGYDSVALKADVEIGGTDQKFNLLVGRQLQQARGMKPQVVITVPILEGLDGTRKMSKSYNNYVGIAEPSQEMYGKLMSASDALMWRYFELLSLRPATELNGLKQQVEAGANPRDVKHELAHELVARYHGCAAAGRAREAFIRRFQQRHLPEEAPEVTLCAGERGLTVAGAIKQAGLTASTAEAYRMVQQGAVRIDGEKLQDPRRPLPTGSTCLLQVGKRRVARITVRP